MQLKMTKPFDVKFVKKMLREENTFISNMFSNMQSAFVTGNQEQQSADDESHGPNSKTHIVPGSAGNRARTFEELFTRLDELKGAKKLTYKDKLLKKNLRSKLKKKTKKEETLMQKKMARTEQLASGMKGLKIENGEAPKVPRPKPVFNSEGKMVFSKFDFSEIGAKKKPPRNVKDPKKILHQLQEKKEKLKQLEQSGEVDKAMNLKEKQAWKTVLAKSSGEKVKDDPDLLKRTIKRKEQQKKRSTKKWNARIETVQKTMQERQIKRQENIQQKKKEKKLKKLKRIAKKGRVLTAF